MARGERSLVPREHGAWAMLLVPPLVAGTVGGFSRDLAFVVAAAVALFTAYPAALVLLRHATGQEQSATVRAGARRRTGWCLAAAMAAGLPLLAGGHVRLLAFLPAAAAAFVGSFVLARKGGRTVLSDLTATAGLTLTGPAALCVTPGGSGTPCLIFYLYHLLFFGGSVFYVHMKMRRPASNGGPTGVGDRVAAGRETLLFQAGTLTGMAGLAFAGAAPASVVIAFLPMAVQTVGGAMTLGRHVRFKRLGFLLLGHSLLFGLLIGRSL